MIAFTFFYVKNNVRCIDLYCECIILCLLIVCFSNIVATPDIVISSAWTVVFNLYTRAKPCGTIQVARGTPVHIPALEN